MTPCVPIDRLATPAALSADERAHVASCARCSALFAEVEAFAAGRADGVPASDLAAAERALGAALERELGGAPSSARVIALPARKRAWWQAGAMRWAVAAAAVVVVASAVMVTRERAPQAPVMRGQPATPLAVVAEPHGAALALGWGAWPQADAYRIEIVSPELVTLATFGPVHATTFALQRGAVPGAASGSGAYCRVVALRAGASLGESEPLAIRLP